MPQVLFVLEILANVGTLLIPLTSATRGRAIWGWFVNALAGGAFLLLIEENYPSWVEPDWHTGNIWALVSWVLFITGLVVAICKPRKRNVPVA